MELRSWVTSNCVRNFPASRPEPAAGVGLDAALNEQLSFQVALRTEEGPNLRVRVAVEAPKGWVTRVRRVGYVPVLHHNTPVERTSMDVDGRGRMPGYVPDPLFDEDTIDLPPFETHAFWITVRPGTTPGRYAIKVTVVPDRGRPRTHTVPARVHDVVVGKRKGFPITHWFYVDALIDWYRTDLFDGRFWEILPPYVEDVADHGLPGDDGRAGGEGRAEDLADRHAAQPAPASQKSRPRQVSLRLARREEIR